MNVYSIKRETWVPHPLPEVFDFFSRAENLERLTPLWMRFRILTPQPIRMRVGTLIDYKLRVHGFPVKWRTRIENWNPPHEFVDLQLKGPYKLWDFDHG
jgi:ligand-binding SRPBCC domain-containing protein